MIGALIKAVGRTGAGRAVSGAKKLLSREGFASAFMQTSAGRVISNVGGEGGKDKSAGKKARVIGGDADPVSKGSADGLRISKQTFEVLTNIDETLKRIVDTLDYQKQQEAAAAEEAANEKSVPPAGEGDAAPVVEQPNIVKKVMKLIAGLALLASTILMPLWDSLKSVVKWLWDIGGTVFEWLKEKIWPILTEDIPVFFTETVPEFFTETLPDIFMKGVDFLRDKMDSIVNSISGMIGSVKSKVGDLILGLVDSPAAKFLLPEGMRSGIKSFATDMKKSGDQAVKNSEQYSATKEQAKKTAEAEDKKKADDAQKTAAEKQAGAETPADKLAPPAPIEDNIQKAVKGAVDASTGMAQTPAGLGASGGMAGSSAGSASYGGMAGSSASVGASGGMAGSGAATPESGAGTAGSSLAAAGSTGGMAASKAAAPVQSGGTGGAVSSASMAASAPEPMYAPPSVSVGGPAPHMNKPKAPSSDVNPVANVPDVFPNLGSLGLLWYHNASVVV